MQMLSRILPNLILAILATLTILGGRPYFFVEQLTALYGTDLVTTDNLTIALLQHRGMMVSVVGFLLVPSIFSKEFGRIAIPLVIFSKLAFVIKLFPFLNQVSTSFYFDIVAIILLTIVYVVKYFFKPSRNTL